MGIMFDLYDPREPTLEVIKQVLLAGEFSKTEPKRPRFVRGRQGDLHIPRMKRHRPTFCCRKEARATAKCLHGSHIWFFINDI